MMFLVGRGRGESVGPGPRGLGPQLHPIMWPARLRLCPSSCFGLRCPAPAPGAPRRRLSSCSAGAASSWAPAAGILLALSGDGAAPGLGPAQLGPPRRLRPVVTAWCRRPQDEGRRGGRVRAGPAEPGGREPCRLGHVPGVRAPRLPGPHGGQSALAAGAQLAPPLPQPGQAQSFQPHVCPALGLRHGEGPGGGTYGGAEHVGGTGWGEQSKQVSRDTGQRGLSSRGKEQGPKGLSKSLLTDVCVQGPPGDGATGGH